MTQIKGGTIVTRIEKRYFNGTMYTITKASQPEYCDRSWHDGDCCEGSRRDYAARPEGPGCSLHRPVFPGQKAIQSEADYGAFDMCPYKNAESEPCLRDADHPGQHVTPAMAVESGFTRAEDASAPEL